MVLKVITAAIVIVFAVIGTLVGYAVGYESGTRYGVATDRLIMEQSAVNNGCGEYYIEQQKVKFRWK